MVRIRLMGCEGCGNKVGIIIGRRSLHFRFLHSKKRCPE